MEYTVKLDLPLLLPDIQGQQDVSLLNKERILKDGCILRLESALQQKKGILRVHIEPDRQPAALCLHYDPNLVTLSEVKRQAEQAGAVIANRYHHATLPIEGMDCSDCVKVIEHSVGRMDGVLSVNVNYALKKMWVEYDRQKVDKRSIAKRVRSLGYEIPTASVYTWVRRNRSLLSSFLSGMLLLASWLGEQFFGFPVMLSTTLYLVAALLGGWDIARHAWHALRMRHFDTDLLMILAASGAILIGRLAEAALLLFLFSLGHALEERVMDRARAAVAKLGEITPKSALVRRDRKEFEIPVEQLLISDLVIVRPGMRLPVDGEVFEGVSDVDQSPVTGEAVPVKKEPGEPVFAGTVNGQGALVIRVTRLAKDSTLARVMKMVEEAQSLKSPTQQTVEKFERIYVPAVLFLTLLVILLPLTWSVPFHESFYRAMIVLVAASPCALALGAPAAILTGVTQAARKGVLVKGGVHLENLGRIKILAFDKTGTLTHGKPEVTSIFLITAPVGSSNIQLFSENDVLSLAAALENHASHPLAIAVKNSAMDRDLVIPAVSGLESLPGRGVKGNLDGCEVHLGSLEMVDELQVFLPDNARHEALRLQDEAKTVMILVVDRQPVGLIALSDTLRTEARETMTQLKRLGIQQTVMLTGDNSHAAEAIASQAGLTGFRAQLLPEDKLQVVGQLLQDYPYVGMVGDGVNDAPALAGATVGIAMGSAGSDVAFETADVALMGDDLKGLVVAVGLGKATRRVVVENLAIALGVIGVTVLAAITGWIGIGLAVILHEGSTLVVVANAFRLLRFEQR
jgi:Zn2+/Cd2+-exporting ATPase